jgi:hypothetical protein
MFGELNFILQCPGVHKLYFRKIGEKLSFWGQKSKKFSKSGSHVNYIEIHM